MNKMQSQVEAFHRKFNVPINAITMWKFFSERAELRSSLIEEEYNETMQALLDWDVEGTADGICDLIYVLLGTAVEMGIDVEPLFDEVHRANMEKVGGGTRADGKIMKPAGWQPPRIQAMLAEQGK